MKELMWMTYEDDYNCSHYPHKPNGESGKTVWGLHDKLGFYRREVLD